MNLENNTPSLDEDKNTKPRPKDWWDKFNIILKPLGGIITAIAIVLLGYYTSNFLEKQKENENDIRLYTQLMSERERAEQSLRTTMFKEIFDRVLKQPNYTKPAEERVYLIPPKDIQPTVESNDKNVNKQEVLRRIRTHVVGIDMISRNFHEFLDMKPLFLHIMWEITVQRGKFEEKYGKDKFSDICNSVGENWVNADPCQELLWQQKELSKIARRVVQKQIDILAEKGSTWDIKIPLEDLCVDKNSRTLQPMDPDCKESGFKGEKTLELRFGKCTRKAHFSILVKRAYPNWNMVRVKDLKVSVTNDGVCDNSFQKVFTDSESEPTSFWVGSFDFPMVDNTYISAREKYAVIFEKIYDETKDDETKDGERKFAKLQLIYFPASSAGLQEKSYYQQKLLEALITQSDLFTRKEQRKMGFLKRWICQPDN